MNKLELNAIVRMLYIFYMLFSLMNYSIIVILDPECNDTDVRLVDGPREGHVELCLDGVWYSVCSNEWDINDAKVVCQQLGYDGRKYYYNGSLAPAISFTTLSQHHIYYCTVHPHPSIWKMLTAEEMRAS